MSELQKRLLDLFASRRRVPMIGGQMIGQEVYSLRASGAEIEALMEAADALDAQAQEIAKRAADVDCALSVLTTRTAQLEDARAEIVALKELVAALQSREVCTVAHDDVETCGYCQRDSLRARLAEAEKDVGRCEWTDDETGNYDTECGHTFAIIDGTPAENQMQWCVYCGKRLIDAARGGA